MSGDDVKFFQIHPADRMADMQQFDFGHKSHARDVWGVVATRLRSLEAQGLLTAGGTG